MNKQLERDLQCSIQSLKSVQLANVLARYEQASQTLCEKTIVSNILFYTEKGVTYECEISFKGQLTKGYGRN